VRWTKSRDGVEWAQILASDDVSIDKTRPEELFQCLATADLLNHAVKCDLTLLGADGVPLHREETPPTVVQLLPEFRKRLMVLLSAGRQAMDVRMGVTPAVLVLDHRGVELQSGGRKTAAAKWNTNSAFALNPHSGARFTLRLTRDKEHECSLGEANQRDMTALLFRCFMAMGVPEIAERVVGRKAALQWRRGRFGPEGAGDLSYSPDYERDPGLLHRRRTEGTDQLNRPLTYRLLTPAERAEQEIFICRYGLAYWQARVTLEHVVSGSPIPLAPSTPSPKRSDPYAT